MLQPWESRTTVSRGRIASALGTSARGGRSRRAFNNELRGRPRIVRLYSRTFEACRVLAGSGRWREGARLTTKRPIMFLAGGTRQHPGAITSKSRKFPAGAKDVVLGGARRGRLLIGLGAGAASRWAFFSGASEEDWGFCASVAARNNAGEMQTALSGNVVIDRCWARGAEKKKSAWSRSTNIPRRRPGGSRNALPRALVNEQSGARPPRFFRARDSERTRPGHCRRSKIFLGERKGGQRGATCLAGFRADVHFAPGNSKAPLPAREPAASYRRRRHRDCRAASSKIRRTNALRPRAGRSTCRSRCVAGARPPRMTRGRGKNTAIFSPDSLQQFAHSICAKHCCVFACGLPTLGGPPKTF